MCLEFFIFFCIITSNIVSFNYDNYGFYKINNVSTIGEFQKDVTTNHIIMYTLNKDSVDLIYYHIGDANKFNMDRNSWYAKAFDFLEENTYSDVIIERNKLVTFLLEGGIAKKKDGVFDLEKCKQSDNICFIVILPKKEEYVMSYWNILKKASKLSKGRIMLLTNEAKNRYEETEKGEDSLKRMLIDEYELKNKNLEIPFPVYIEKGEFSTKIIP